MRLRPLIAAGLAALALWAVPARSRAADVTVFAAASLKNALDRIVSDYTDLTGKSVVVSYGASSTLARQIEQGAPADIFVSADLEWMDHLENRDLLRAETRIDLLGNRIVLIAPASTAKPITLEPHALAAALGKGRLAVAQVASVPAGRYGKAALERLGLWETVSGRLAEAENVRAALSFVARGEAPLGIVYETDARAEPKVQVVARFPETSHPAIVYPAAIVKTSRGGEAAAFLETLRTTESQRIFSDEGFLIRDR
jgi:molybdate transport system substrate-binding protein